MIDNLKNCADGEFFVNLEQCVGFKIPIEIKNVLQFNYYNTAIALSQLDGDSTKEMENAMRTDFDTSVVLDGESIQNYLRRYSNNQKNFKLFGGQIRIIHSIADYSRGVYEKLSKEAKEQEFNCNAPIQGEFLVLLSSR